MIKWKVTDTDTQYITRGISLLIRRGGVSSEPDAAVKNVYSKDDQQTCIPDTILDRNTLQLGEHLLMRYACKEGMFGLTKHV